MQTTLIAATAVLAVGLVLPASAQEELLRQRVRAGQDGTIQSSITMTLPLDPDKNLEVQHEDALRAIYATAGRSCAVVTGTVADSCEVSNIISNVRSNEGGERNNRITVTAQVLMRVEFKASISTTP